MYKMGHGFEPSKEQQNRVFAIGWYSSPSRCDKQGIRSCPGRVSVNSYKETWYHNTQVDIDPNVVSKEQVASKLARARYHMFKKKSDRTKWERIGRPLFVETPLEVVEVVTEVLFKFGKLKTAWKRLTK